MTLDAWNPQGHRLVALVAANHLTHNARQQVQALLGTETLADVAVWANLYLEGNNQTSFWHYVNIPTDARSYNRDRDCPTQPGVSAGGRGDKWRDCVVDRILLHQERLANSSLDRADRAIALKFLVHLVGDLHQPFHALGVERGGNGIPVSVLDPPPAPTPTVHPIRATCTASGIRHSSPAVTSATRSMPRACLERIVAQRRWSATAAGSADAWAMESHAAARRALLPPQGAVDEAYYRANIATVDEQLALGGWRLASLVNQALDRAAP